MYSIFTFYSCNLNKIFCHFEMQGKNCTIYWDKLLKTVKKYLILFLLLNCPPSTPPLPNNRSSSAANSCYGCCEAGSVTIEGPLRRKTMLKEGRKPKVRLSLISLWFKLLCFLQIWLNMSAYWKEVSETFFGIPIYLLCYSWHRGPDFGSLCLDQH